MRQKLEELTLQWDNQTVFTPGMSLWCIVTPCFYLLLLILTIIFVLGLTETTPIDWTHGEKFLFVLLYPFWEGCKISLLLLMWFPFMASEPSFCDLCMHTTRAGNVVTRTLLFHTYYSCAGIVIKSCTHNNTIYSVCSHGNQHIWSKPTYRPWEQWLEIRSSRNPGNLISHTQMFSPDKPVSMLTDACTVIDNGGCGGTDYGYGGLD
jgi:hypothetical protein